MKISDCMSPDVQMCAPDNTIQDVAKLMRDTDIGVVPIAEDDRLVGVVTDRDIVVRCIANGLSPTDPARAAMSSQILYCFEDQELDEVAANMAELKIRRMPVLDRNKRLTGIISLGDIAQIEDSGSAEAFRHISQDGGPHTQAIF